MFVGDWKSEIKSKMVEYSSHDSPYMRGVNSMELERWVGKQEEEYSPDLADMLRRLKTKTRSFKEDNNRLIEA